MNTLELLDRMVSDKVKKDGFESPEEMYLDYLFTMTQKQAIRQFLFEPTKAHALKAIKTTPKAWLYIRHVGYQDEIVEMVSSWIKQGEVNGVYYRTIVTNSYFTHLLEMLLQYPCGEKFERYVKKHEMVRKLKR